MYGSLAEHPVFVSYVQLRMPQLRTTSQIPPVCNKRVYKKQRLSPCDTCRRAGATVIFAYGEFYCFVEVFGYLRVIFATRAWEADIISLRPQSCKATRSNITVACNNITLTRSAYHFQFDMAFVSTNAVLVRKSRWTFGAHKISLPQRGKVAAEG